MKKITDSKSNKAKECKSFENRALDVHVNNLVAHYGEEAVTRALAIRLVASKAEKKAA